MSWKYYGWSPKTLGGQKPKECGQGDTWSSRSHSACQILVKMKRWRDVQGPAGGGLWRRKTHWRFSPKANQIRKVQIWEPQVVWGKRATANVENGGKFEVQMYLLNEDLIIFFLSFIMFLWKETASLKEIIERWSLLKSGDDWSKCEINTEIITTSRWSRRGFWVLEIEGRTG